MLACALSSIALGLAFVPSGFAFTCSFLVNIPEATRSLMRFFPSHTVSIAHDAKSLILTSVLQLLALERDLPLIDS